MQEEHDIQARILRALRFRPKGMTITEVAKQIGVTRNSVSKHLEILQIAGKVEVRTIGNAKLFSLTHRIPLSAFLCFTKNLILIIDSSRRIVQVNDQCLKHLRRTKDDLIGKTIQEAAPPVISTPEALAVFESPVREQIITEIPCRRNGDEFFYQLQVIPTTFDDGERGCTIVLEDITERKRYVRDMEFLARTAMELVDMPLDADIYQYVAERVHELVPEGLVYVNSYDEVSHQFFMHVIMDQQFRNGVKELLGQEIVGMTLGFRDIFGAPYHLTIESISGIIEHVFRPESEATELSFYDICFQEIPEEICDEILSRFNIGKLVHVGLVWQRQLFGIVGVFLPPHGKLKDRQAVESFTRQASIAIARRQTEERLRRSERRFRDVVDSSPLAAAIIDADGRYLYLNRQFTETFGYTLEDIPTGREWFRLAFPDDTQRREAIAAWQEDLLNVGRGQPRPRTFPIRSKDGEVKAILFRPVELCDGTQYVTYEDVTEERRAYRVLIEEIVELKQQLAALSGG
jgi:PAS domain S-box-containing protein